MTVDVTRMTLTELTALSRKIDEQIPLAKARERDKLKSEMVALAAKHGMKLNDIFGASGGYKQVVLPKWQDKKTGVFWSGRGRQPRNFDRARAVALSPTAA